MNKVLLSVFLSFFLSLSLQANVSLESQDLEKIIQQLDWEMTRVGTKGMHYRNRAVRKLTCIGEMGEEEKGRVLFTAGRLLGHANAHVREAALQIFANLSASYEGYLQRFHLRSQPIQHWTDMQNVLEDLVTNKLEGLEIIHEFYPRLGEAERMSELSDLFFQRTKKILKTRLRIFSLYEPTSTEWTAIYSIRGQVIQDFHTDQVDTDFICPAQEG